jgi:tetratricopeptide (TPR) repeat protein
MADRNKQIDLSVAYYTKGRKLWTKGEKDDALSMFRKALAMQEALLGTYHKQTARTYYWVGFALKNKKEYDKALVAYRRTLKIRMTLFGEDDLSTEDVIRGVGDVLKEKGHDDTAVEAYVQAVSDSIQLEKKANVFFEKREYELAETSYQKCLEIEEAALGKFPLDIADIYCKIAEVNRSQGEYDMAIVTYRDALSIYEAKLGKDHPDTVKALTGIETSVQFKGLRDEVAAQYRTSVSKSIQHVKDGTALSKNGDYDKAIAEYRKALELEEASLGKLPLTAADVYCGIAAALRRKGEYDLAILEYRTALTIFIYELGSDHPNIITTSKEIGLTMKKKGHSLSAVNKYLNTMVYSIKYERYGDHIRQEGDPAGAIEEYQKSLALEVSAFGKLHLTQAGLYSKIAGALCDQGKIDFAVVNYRNAFFIFQHTVPSDYPQYLKTLKGVGFAIRKKGLSDEQVFSYREAVSRSVEYERDGDALLAEGHQDNAMLKYCKAVELEESSLGKFHLCTADLYSKMARTLKDKGRYDVALVQYRNIFAIYQLSLGTDHPNTQRAYEELGVVARLKGLDEEAALKYSTLASNSIQFEKSGDVLVKNDSFDRAIVEYHRAIDIEESGLGRLHPTTAAIRSKIADALRLKGKCDMALVEYRHALAIFHAYLGLDHPDAVKTLEKLGLAVQGLGFHETFAHAYQKNVSESISHECTGDALLKKGEKNKAVIEYRQAIAIEVSVMGKLSSSTADLHRKVARIYRDNGDYETSLLFYSKVLAMYESIFGEDHAETVQSFNELCAVAEKHAAATGSDLEGWTTLKYIMMVLIGLLVLILSVVKSLSNRESAVKRKKLKVNIKNEINDEDDKDKRVIEPEVGKEDYQPSLQRQENDKASSRRKAREPEERKTPTWNFANSSARDPEETEPVTGGYRAEALSSTDIETLLARETPRTQPPAFRQTLEKAAHGHTISSVPAIPAVASGSVDLCEEPEPEAVDKTNLTVIFEKDTKTEEKEDIPVASTTSSATNKEELVEEEVSSWVEVSEVPNTSDDPAKGPPVTLLEVAEVSIDETQSLGQTEQIEAGVQSESAGLVKSGKKMKAENAQSTAETSNEDKASKVGPVKVSDLRSLFLKAFEKPNQSERKDAPRSPAGTPKSQVRAWGGASKAQDGKKDNMQPTPTDEPTPTDDGDGGVSSLTN